MDETGLNRINRSDTANLQNLYTLVPNAMNLSLQRPKESSKDPQELSNKADQDEDGQLQSKSSLLPTDTTYLTTYEKKALANEYKKLRYFSDRSNQDVYMREQRKLIYNLSILEILQNVSQTIIDIINDITDRDISKNLTNMVKIFTKNDRLLYLGILLTIVAILILLVLHF